MRFIIYYATAFLCRASLFCSRRGNVYSQALCAVLLRNWFSARLRVRGRTLGLRARVWPKRVRLLYVHLLFVSVRALFSSVVILLVAVGDEQACVRSAFVYVHARFGVARVG